MLVFKVFIGNMVVAALQAYSWILIAYLIATWFVQNRYAGWFVFLSRLVDPPLAWLRRVTKNKLTIGMLDLTPLVLFFAIHLLTSMVRSIFFR
ncbi:YggT family protein [Acanthopleuribacter pedis]|uniref:YggT family protein n=1 Tax=Acanthopleuribacter pedis TaxID=442870 RepID=A0A8J7QD38_9BACT|nr:YggT family protein [Acanthopleuribacter pedis]MBO1316853.1 YggT family protein [Acanthopleuribacter pedis]